MFFGEFLVDDNRLDGAFVRRLLNGVFVLGGNFFDHCLCHVVTHLENFRTGVNAKAAGSTGILDSDSHSYTPFLILRFFTRLWRTYNNIRGLVVLYSVCVSLSALYSLCEK